MSKKEHILQVLGCYDYKCVSCGVDTFDKKFNICDDCRNLIHFNDGKTCNKCGRAILGEGDFCGTCSKNTLYYDKIYSCLVLEGRTQELMHSFKFGGFAYIVNCFASMLADKVVKQNIDFDVVTFVPLSGLEIRDRGFNQSQLLADAFCDILGIEKPLDCLHKIRETLRQEKLGFVERQSNISNAITVLMKEKVSGKKILVIDDVMTTGATINECARALKKAKATNVIGITVASRKQRILSE